MNFEGIVKATPVMADLQHISTQKYDTHTFTPFVFDD